MKIKYTVDVGSPAIVIGKTLPYQGLGRKRGLTLVSPLGDVCIGPLYLYKERSLP